jgi:nucleoside 2-deoxyribosyltransferase
MGARIYIAGPMRYREGLNWDSFDKARDLLSTLGMSPVSPADLDRSAGLTPKDVDFDSATMKSCFRRDIDALLGCDAIALLPGWAESKGAMAEYMLAKAVGMPAFKLSVM